MKKNKWIPIGLAAAVVVLGVGCDTFLGERQHRHNSSLYSYLYADEKDHVDTPSVPVLSLPLHIGVAFVPTDSSRRDNYTSWDDLRFPESDKLALAKQISAEFKKYPFVQSIDLIPSAYLSPHGGFANLDQIRTMYGVDVMVLLSYDQVQFTGEGALSMAYATVVGVYLIPAEKNDTRTMIDAAVFDIASRKLLFRAPGVATIKGSATPIDLDTELRKDSVQGFKEAAANLKVSLQTALADFKERVTNAPTEYKIEYKPGYKGGAFGGIETLLIGGLGAGFLWIRRNAKA